ncbi:hypothetical protein ABZ806_17980 [Spirillospora sp. NPDC047418]
MGKSEHAGALPRFRTPADYRAAASDPNTDVHTFCYLAQCPYPFVWQALAVNPRTPTRVLGELCSKSDSAWNDSRQCRA